MLIKDYNAALGIKYSMLPNSLTAVSRENAIWIQ